MSWLARYRHSKGFGVHSPFAFRFITEVIGERLPYYDYEVINDAHQRLLYRLACYFEPETVSSADGADIAPVLMACPQTRPVDADAAMVVADANAEESVLKSALRRHAVIVIMGDHRRALTIVRAALEEMGWGMTFANHRTMAVVVAWERLPRQDFTVRF